MEVYGKIYHKVDVDPITVIGKLKELELSGDRDWVFEREGKYYHGYESGGGSHSWNEETEITKEQYDYIKALELVKKYLEKKNAK